MFAYGDFVAEALPGLDATLVSWTSLAGLKVDTIDSSTDGFVFGQATYGKGRWAFNLMASAATPAAVLDITSTVTGACDPKAGMRDLLVNIHPGWRWRAVVAEQLDWERSVWVPGEQCQMTTQLVFTASPFGYAVPDETWTLGGGPAEVTHLGGGVWEVAGHTVIHEGGGVWQVGAEVEYLGDGLWQVGAQPADDAILTRLRGNTESYPTIEIVGVLSAAQSVTITVGGRTVDVGGPLTTGQVLRMDYADMDFGIWAGPVKAASVVSRMSSYTQLTLPMGPTPVSITSTGTLSNITVHANSRRI